MIELKWISKFTKLINIVTIIAFLTVCCCDDITSLDNHLIYALQLTKRYAHVHVGSYFGYSIASYVGQSQPSCLVGAPNATYGNAAKGTGAIYRLDLDMTFPFCSVVPIANTDDMRKEYGTPIPGTSNSIGGTVAAASNSLDGIQLGCDPQYLFKSNLMNQTLIKSTSHVTNFKLPIKSNNYVGIGNCALYTGTSMRYVSIDACQSQEEGTCLAGFSADVKPGAEVGEAYVALGMPGSYLTEGNVFLGHYRGREQISAIRLKTSSNDLKHMGFGLGYAVVLSKLIRPNISGDITTGLENSSMNEEYAKLVRNKFTGSHEEQINYNLLASSSLWINNDYNGIVMILNHALDLGGIVYLNDKWGHIGSFFGYSLTVLDLDGNGLLDIVVGSPYFTYRDSRLQSADELSNKTASQINKQWGKLLPDIGRVYIFYGYPQNATISPTTYNRLKYDIPDYFSHEPVILSGPQSVKGRFGHSLTSISDVDGDGVEDLAVGCPYCQDPDGGEDVGAVFIYLGRKSKQINDEPFQSIWPSQLPKESPLTVCGNNDFFTEQISLPPRKFSAFGWSLSAGSDLDGNHAPDLMVGDVESDQVVLIRARNTVWFDSPEWYLPMRPTLPWLGSNRALCGKSCEFNVQLYATIHHHKSITKQQLSNWKVRIHIDLDTNLPHIENKRLIGRSTSEYGTELSTLDIVVELHDFQIQSNRINLLNLTIQPLSERVHALLWKPIIINATISPIFDPMPFTNKDKSIASWILHPFLGSRQFVSQPMQFANPSCGPDNICVTDLQVKMSDLSIGPTQNTIIYFRERISQRNLTVGIGNLGENAYAAKLRMTFPIQFSFTLPHNLVCQTHIPSHIEYQTQVLCDLGDPLSYTGNILHPFVFQLNTAGAFRALDDPLQNDQAMVNTSTLTKRADTTIRNRIKRNMKLPDEVLVIAEVISGNLDINMRNNEVIIRYKLQLAAKIELSSSSVDRTTIDSRNFSIQPYAMQRIHPETMGPELKHIYLVTNSGPSPLDQLWVNVSIPMQTKDGDYLVYFLDRLRYQAGDGGPPRIETMSPEVVNAEGYIRGYCLTPEWALNPLRLNAVHRGYPVRSNAQSRTSNSPEVVSTVEIPKTDLKRNRRETTTLSKTTKDAVRSTRSILHGIRKRQQEIIKCGEKFADQGVPICATIRCRVDGLSRGDAVRIVVRGWVWADTYFRHKISDLAIISEAQAELNATAFGIKIYGNRTVQSLAISQNFVFDGINILLLREIPLWPIILGCLLGLLFLTCIVFGMWKCGFFRRKRWYDLPNSLPPNHQTTMSPNF